MKATTTIGFSRPEHNHVPASPGKACSTLHEAIKNTPAGILSDGRTYQHHFHRDQASTASLHGLNQTLEIFRIYVADVPDTESVGLGNLARIYHEALRFQLGIESLEVEVLLRIKERSDDRRLHGYRQQCLEAERLHALYQYFVVLAVTGVTGCHSPSAFSSSMASLKARTTWVGEVKRHLP